MRLLLALALRYRKNYALLLITAGAMLLGTIGSQLEMLSFGVLTSESGDFFKLFGKPPHHQSLQFEGVPEVVTQEQVLTQWDKIDRDGKGYITKDDALDYLARKDKHHLLTHWKAQLNKYLGLMDRPSMLVLFFITVALVKGVSYFGQRYTTALVSIRVSQRLRQDYFDHIQSLPMSFYNTYNIGALSTRVSGDSGMVALAINSLLINYLQTPFTILSTLLGLYYISPRLFSLIFLIIPPLVLPIWVLTRKVKKITRDTQLRREQFASILYEFLAGIQTIKSYAMEESSSQKYSSCNDTVVQLEEKGSRYGHALRPILHFFGTLFLVGVILWGFYIAHMTLSELLVFCGLLSLLYEPLKKFADENMNIQRGVVSAERIMEIMNIEAEIDDKPGAINFPGIRTAITFKDVSFRYNQGDEHAVLDRFNLTIHKGEFVAIVGPTGVGKSTIVQLLLRLYDVDEGVVTIDDVDIRDFKQRSLRLGMAYVPQKPFLFGETIKSNIAFAQEPDMVKVRSAADLAHASEFIEKLPSGYETKIGEMGKDLSGGQQQRLALARALYRESSILILDEATSALDVITEEKIKAALQELRGLKTLIVIAHRLSTIAHADRIVFIDAPGQVTIGNHRELMERSPAFAQMWESMVNSHTGCSEETSELNPAGDAAGDAGDDSALDPKFEMRS